MWIDTPLEGILWTLFIVCFLVVFGIESEQRVRNSWLMSLKHRKNVSPQELIKFIEKESADCHKKKNRWSWGGWIVLGLLLLIYYSA